MTEEGATARGDSHSELPMDPDVGDSSGPMRPLHLRPHALLLVFVGGVFGTLARSGLEAAFPHGNAEWPIATFGINIVGAFLLGLLLENLGRRGIDAGGREKLRLLAGTGFCGAFTTYSTFALEAVILTRDGHWPTALAYGASTVVLGVLAAWGGIVTGSAAHARETT